MKTVLRIAVLLFVCAPFAVAASPSSAQTGPSVTVTPDTGLVGGQTVTLEGSGFTSSSSQFGWCQARLAPKTGPFDCAGASTFDVATDTTGAFTMEISVARFIRPTPFAEAPVLDCAQSVQCGIDVLDQSDTAQFGTIVAVAALNFAPQPPATFAIKGSVTGPDSRPLANVPVFAFTPEDTTYVGSHQTVTDGNGAYQLVGVDPGLPYALRFGPPAGTDLIAQWYDNQTHRNTSNYPVRFPRAFNDPVLTLQNQQLAEGGAITGIVTDSSGSGVAGATVWAYGPGDNWVGSFGARTAADGSYRINGVRPANYKIRFMPRSTSGLAIEWYDNATLSADAKSVSVTAGATTTGVDAQLSPTS